MKEIWQIIIAISIILGIARAQIENQFGRFKNRAKEKTVIELEPKILEIIPPVLELVIDPNEYVVGAGDIFGVNIIPYTFSFTMLDELKVNSQVNIEIDIIARHIEQLLNNKTSA